MIFRNGVPVFPVNADINAGHLGVSLRLAHRGRLRLLGFGWFPDTLPGPNGPDIDCCQTAKILRAASSALIAINVPSSMLG